MDWFAGQLSANPSFQQQVEEALNVMRLEQDLIALRELQGVSQAQLAKALGVSQPAIAKLESGRAKNIELRTLVRAVSALGGTVKITITGRAKGKHRGVKKCSVPAHEAHFKSSNHRRRGKTILSDFYQAESKRPKCCS